MPNMQKAGENAPDASLVAEVICNAITDGSWKMRYSANSRMLLMLRKFLLNALFYTIVRQATKGQ
ncbi:MAG: hypothetical protein ACR2MD_04510 [Aridibacter sp.]